MDQLEERISSCLIGSDQLTIISTDLFKNNLSKNKNILIDGFDDEQIFQQIEV